MLKKFTVKDISFIAILSAALVLAGLLTMPLVMSNHLFGIRNMVSALLYSLFTMLGLLKVSKMGTLSILGLFHGVVLLMMTPVMFMNMLIGALVSELVVFAIYRSYDTDKAKFLASVLFIPMTFPITLIFTMLIHGKTVSEIMEKPLLAVLFFVASILLSVLGAKIGYMLGRELKKAGKL
jgi:hypothetical protein